MFENRNWRRLILTVAIAGLIFGGQLQQAKAAWGDLDTSFGTNGMVQETALGYSVGEVVIQADGKILVTGSKLASNGKKRFMLRRYLSNGTPDASFGNNGSAVLSTLLVLNNDYSGVELNVLSSGKIVVLGQNQNKIAVWMVKPDGTGDDAFGYKGLKTFSNYEFSRARLGVSHGKPVIGFYDSTTQRVVLIKLNLDGTEDTTFGTNGKSYTNIYGTMTQAASFEMITENDTHKITVAGMSLITNTPPIILERKLNSGAADLTFNPSGHGQGQQGSSGLNGLAKLSGGKYVYTFIDFNFGDIPGYLSRATVSGVLEQRISAGAAARLIGIQPDGKIVVQAGYGFGRYDQNFNGQGSFLVYPNLSDFQYRNHTFQADNKMVVAGIEDDKLTLKRLLAN